MRIAVPARSAVQYGGDRDLVSCEMQMKTQCYGGSDTDHGHKNKEDIRFAMSLVIASVHTPSRGCFSRGMKQIMAYRRENYLAAVHMPERYDGNRCTAI
ncbi:hypothetical protein BOW51_00725 [Solemya velesiana gill symbiont]|uniref:Uncharacterized protein n=1 Tax=Solemya velesiana gill symbiont TaxID=1918948 RepID=A0A1T2KYI3_9GAMM|nr:hypothetical protein BOW51_00725 [Solemya velesiana gill symbiont]